MLACDLSMSKCEMISLACNFVFRHYVNIRKHLIYVCSYVIYLKKHARYLSWHASYLFQFTAQNPFISQVEIKKSDLAILILHVDVILSDVAILHEKNNNLGCWYRYLECRNNDWYVGINKSHALMIKWHVNMIIFYLVCVIQVLA